jgi:flagellar motor switch protein FliG
MTASIVLDDAERAAVLVMVLGEQQASTILGQLGPDELRRLGETMCGLGEIGPRRSAASSSGPNGRACRASAAPKLSAR